jgi:hypothetical protein
LERASKKPTKKGLSSQPKRCWREFTSQKSSAPTASLHCQIAKPPHRQIFLAPNLDARNRRRAPTANGSTRAPRPCSCDA